MADDNDYLFRKIYLVGSESATWCGKFYVLLHRAIRLTHRTAINGLVIAGDTLYPYCNDSAVLDISSERTIHCALLKAQYSNHLERNKTITNFFLIFLSSLYHYPLS